MKDAIYDRISVRTYEKKALNEKERQVINDMMINCEKIKGPFGNFARFFADHQETNLDDEAKRIGTYGFIKNAPSFIGGSIINEYHAIIDYGYIFEYLILELTQKGFGTCWLGGTFDRLAFQEFLKEGEVIPAITPIGYPGDRQSIRERAIRLAIKANKRKDYQEIFFIKDISHPLKETKDFPNKLALDFVRIAPSGSNKQPWRIIIDHNHFHLFLERTPNYATGRPFVMQYLDMGIALCHLELGLKELGLNYQFQEMKVSVPDKFEYILSVMIKNKTAD